MIIAESMLNLNEFDPKDQRLLETYTLIMYKVQKLQDYHAGHQATSGHKNEQIE